MIILFGEYKQEFYAEKKDNLGVVIIGTSSTFLAIMPMELWGIVEL